MAGRAVLFGLLTFCFVNATVLVQAQTVTAGPDSVLVKKDSVQVPKNATEIAPKTEKVNAKKEKGLSKPGRAALFSAILPGAGQVYNGHYWKVPVIYAVGGGIGYFLVTNNTQYTKYRLAYKYRIDGDPNTVDEFDTKYPGTAGTNFLRTNRDYYHTNRDLSVILLFLAYGLNIVEANVGAHLNEFDISDDLTLNWQPTLNYTGFAAPPVPMLTLNFRLKK